MFSIPSGETAHSWRHDENQTIYDHIFFLNLFNMLTAISPHHWHIGWLPLAARRAHDVTCSPPGSSPFLGKLQPMPGEHTAFLTQWKPGHPCLGFRPPFCSKHAQWGACQDSNLTSASCWTRPVVSRAALRVALSRTCTKFCPETPCHPGKHSIAEKPDVVLVVEGCIQYHQFTSPTIVNGIPYHD